MNRDPRLVDFTYPGEAKPDGVLAATMPPELMAIVAAVAGSVRNELDGRRRDCRYACAAWLRALACHGIACECCGGEGVDDDVFVDYVLVPLNRRSGYLEADRLVHRHHWLLLGPDRRLFDPTAHQFDDRGGISLDNYIVDGQPVYS